MNGKQYTLTKEYSMRTPVHHKSTREEETAENYIKPKNQPQPECLYMEYDTLGNKCSYNNREHYSAGISIFFSNLYRCHKKETTRLRS